MSDRKWVVGIAACLLLVRVAVAGPGEEALATADSDSNVFRWNETELEAALAAAPGEGEAGDRPVLEVPSPFGGSLRFELVRSPLMEESLANEFGRLRTFRGQAVEDGHPRADTLRLVATPWGYYAQVLSPSGDFLVRPRQSQFEVGVIFEEAFPANAPAPSSGSCASSGELPADGPDGDGDGSAQPTPGLRTYRLAVATSQDWSIAAAKQLPSAAQDESPELQTLASVLILVSRVTGIFEKELGIRFLLVSGTREVLSLDLTVPIPGQDQVRPMKAEEVYERIQSKIGLSTTFLGGPEYETFHVGHVFVTGNEGLSKVASVCTENKGLGVTGWLANWDSAAVNLFAHELGHQFGAQHSFNDGTSIFRFAESAFEPGSGSTIMSYAGRCGEDNVQSWCDAYFHAGSLAQIRRFLANSDQPHPPEVDTGNHAPYVVAPAGELQIPPGTPFILRPAELGDSDGDEVTLCVEQIDEGETDAGLDGAGDGSTPLFRSLPPSRQGERSFPRVCQLYEAADRVAPAPALPNRGEMLPSAEAAGRTLTFRMTVRDNRSSGGATSFVDVPVKVAPSDPFRVFELLREPTTQRVLAGQHRLFWRSDVLESLQPGIQVRILLSLDGGRTWRALIESTENDGEETIFLPCQPVCGARIRVESLGNPYLTLFAVTRSFGIEPIRSVLPIAVAVPLSADGSALSAEGELQAAALAADLLPQRPRVVLHTNGVAARLTALFLAERLETPAAPLPTGFSYAALPPDEAEGIVIVVGTGEEEWESLGLGSQVPIASRPDEGILALKLFRGGATLSRLPFRPLSTPRRLFAKLEADLARLRTLVPKKLLPADRTELLAAVEVLRRSRDDLSEQIASRKGIPAVRARKLLRDFAGQIDAVADLLEGAGLPSRMDALRVHLRLGGARGLLDELRRTMGW